MRAVHRLVFAAIVSLGAVSACAARADDQDRAREAVAAGRIVPLSVIVERALARFGGRILDVEFEDDDDDEHHGDGARPARLRYEVKLLTADGRILKLDYDAASGALIGERGGVRGHRGRGDDDEDE